MKLLAATVLAVASLSSCSVVKSPSDTFELLILHNNDMHARFEQTSQLSGACTTADREAGKCYGGFPRVAHVVKEARKAAQTGEGPPVLYLNAGDTYTGTAWFTIYKWKIAAEFVNALQPDAVSLGNHEFDEPVDTGLVPFIKNLSAPVLAANLILDKEPELKAENNLFKSIILTKNGVKIGIIGYLTPETKYLAPKNNVEFEDEVPAIRKEVKKLKQNNVNILIALGHSGFIKDLQIARDVEDLDLVIGGHSNTFLWNNNSTSEKPEIPEGLYPVEVKQANGRIVRVVQAYAYTKYMGQLHLIFNSNGEIIQCDGNPLLLDQNVPRDAELLKTVNKYRADISRIENEVVGSSYVTLYGHHSCRTKECNMGDLVTDAILNYTNTQYRDEYPDVTQAIIQGGRFRASISHPNIPFDVTRGDLMTVFPFSDSLSLITMNGKVLKQSLEHSVSTWRTVDSTGQFQQFSGMKVVYDLARPVGTRVVKASAVCVTCGGKMEDIEDEYEYNIMMPTFLGNGGDGYTMFEKLAKVTIPYGELESLLYYLAQYGPVSTQLDGRIMILNEDKVVNYLDTDAKIEARRPETSHGNTIDSIKLFYIMIAVILCIESN